MLPASPSYVPVPNGWDDYEIDGQALPNQGYATYHLTLYPPQIDQIYGLYFDGQSTAANLWVDGKLLAVDGLVGRSRAEMEPRGIPQSVFFKPTQEQVEIVVQVSNFYHRNAGLRNAIRLDLAGQIHQFHLKGWFTETFLFSILLIIGLYHISLYIFRRDDPSPLLFAILTLLLTVRTGLREQELLLSLIPGLHWPTRLRIEYWTFFLGIPLFASFMRSLYPDEIHRWFVRLAWGAAIAFSLFTFLTDPLTFSYTPSYYQLIILLQAIYYVPVLSQILRRRREGAGIIAFVVLTSVITIIIDILHLRGLLPFGNTFSFGFLIFIFAQAVLLSLRFSKAFHLVESMSQRLMTLDRLKDQFLANTSHELRTPLNGIIGLSQSLIDGATGKLSQETEYSLKLIINSSKRLSNLVNDILDFSRLKNHDLTLQSKVLDMYTLTEVVLELSQPLIGSKSLQLINNLPSNSPAVLADENRVQQIMHNLVDNAIKFTAQGQVSVSGELRTEENDPPRSFLAISVRDTGIGIPAEKFEQVFQSFEQVDGSVAREYGGAGLGLAVTKQLVALHGGRIWVESRPGEGSCFTFTLPLASGESCSVTSPVSANLAEQVASDIVVTPARPEVNGPTTLHHSTSAPGQPTNGVNQAYQILIVDDEPVNLQVLQNHLSLKNYKVTQAHNGQEALQLMNDSHNFDLVILDLMMPRMSGYELSQKIRQRYSSSQLPVVMLTAKDQVADLVMGFKAGANDYLTKPVNRDELLTRVNTLLSLKRAQDHLRHSEAKYRRIFEESHDMIFVAQYDGQLVDVNPACEVVLGYTRQEAMRLNVLDVMIDPQQAIEFRDLVIEQGALRDFELQLRHKTGRVLNGLVTGSRRDRDDGGQPNIQGIVRDITAQRQAEQEHLRLITMQQELYIAQEIQQSLLAHPSPDWPNLEAICFCNPARQVGGDFYSYHVFTPGDAASLPHTYALAVGDVSGKGVSAALLMATSLSQFDASLALDFDSPIDRIAYLDKVISPYTRPREQNCALCYIELVLPAENVEAAGRLDIVNAGCIPPYIKRKHGPVEHPDIGGFALGQGLGSEAGYKQQTLSLQAGDIIVLTSDGVVEANNEAGDIVGFDYLTQIIQNGPTDSAAAMLEHVKDALAEFTGQAEQYDDMTIVVVRV